MPELTRRHFLAGSAAGALLAAAPLVSAEARSPFGICIYSYGGTRRFATTLDFLDHCHELGAAGIQMPLTSLDSAFAAQVRAKTAQYGMYYEGIVSLPGAWNGKTDAAAFEQQIVAAKAAGASVVRSACLPSRRYETFTDAAQWEQFKVASHNALNTAKPILEKHKVALALENHKDWTIDEMHALLEKHSGEYLGSCLDFGNNIALLDPPDAVLKLAPFAISTHVKDIAVQPDPKGFLMAEVPLGEGVVSVSALVSAIRKARPANRFNFEMITRDPLVIPCKTDAYWVTFPDRKAAYLEPALRLAQSHTGPPLTQVASQPKDDQIALAETNLKLCLEYARRHFAS